MLFESNCLCGVQKDEQLRTRDKRTRRVTVRKSIAEKETARHSPRTRATATPAEATALVIEVVVASGLGFSFGGALAGSLWKLSGVFVLGGRRWIAATGRARSQGRVAVCSGDGDRHGNRSSQRLLELLRPLFRETFFGTWLSARRFWLQLALIGHLQGPNDIL